MISMALKRWQTGAYFSLELIRGSISARTSISVLNSGIATLRIFTRTAKSRTGVATLIISNLMGPATVLVLASSTKYERPKSQPQIAPITLICITREPDTLQHHCMYVFESENFRFRELSGDDAQFGFDLNSDPEVIQYTGDPPFASVEEARVFMDAYTETYRRYR